MTSCEECGYDWAAAPGQAVAAIAGLPNALSEVLDDLNLGNDDDRLRMRPAPDVWSPLEYIAHTGDAIGWYSDRIHRVITEHRPALEAFDWDTHTATQRYHQRRLADIAAEISRRCASLTSELTCFDDADWKREGTGSDGQPRTIAQLAHRAAHEAQHHLRDIKLGLAAAPTADKLR